MSFKSTLKLDSKLFSSEERQVILAPIVRRAAKEFRRDLQEKMIQSPHTGKITTRGKARGEGFRRRHQASRRGERPAPDTNNLVNSTQDRPLSELSAEVEVKAEYGEILQKNGRLVMTDEDVREAEIKFNRKCYTALLELL